MTALTVAQRRVLMNLPGQVGPGRGMAAKALVKKGLIQPHHRYAYQYVLTEKGAEVRKGILNGQYESD